MKAILRETGTFISRCRRAYKKTFGKTIVHVTFSKERNMLTNKKIAIIGGGQRNRSRHCPGVLVGRC